MGDFIAYLDTSEVLPGRLEELKTAMAKLAEFVEENEPRIISYSVHFAEDGSEMSVLHFHKDVESLKFHMDVAGAKFPPIAPLIRMKSIEIFGHPSEEVLAQSKAKAKLLGSATVIVRELHAGFARFGRD
ncbi:hypothetical protein [Arthrobacter sp. M4]|uniref:hypothetical protein n=1 Tax=Arthrobacter sp. M4 TaxID=218160 RepID=UPI001CDBC195|nr:hypothetical protein [Arthrobacter sp. M4]MCA4134182.1 hypothetical protein [Arthrobacter sp. M4]